jgi:hypothetical protein
VLSTSDDHVLTMSNVWSSSDMLDSHTTIHLNNSELHIIDYLGQARRSQAMTEGVIGVGSGHFHKQC